MTFPDAVEQHLLRDYGPRDCWGWRGPTEGSSGYPMINQKGVRFSARRFIYEHATGHKARGTVRVTCGNVGCVNPEHLA